RRVGEERTFHVDVRIVAATAKDLRREAAADRFRWDLFYRVSTVVVPVPPLRQRRGDLPMLVEHFAGLQSGSGQPLRFSRDAMARLLDYPGPGNIRELRNLIERLHILHEEGEVRGDDLPAEFGSPQRLPDITDNSMLPLHEVERRHVERVLEATGWN